MVICSPKCIDYVSRRSKLCPDRDPGAHYRRHSATNWAKSQRPKLCKSIMVHSKAKEDKCGSSWAYLSSYIYHQLLIETQKSRNLPGTRRPPGAKTLPLGDVLGQIPATEALGCRCVSIRRLRKISMIVVGHNYRVIYITSPS